MAWILPASLPALILLAHISSSVTSAKSSTEDSEELESQPEDYDPTQHPIWGLMDTDNCGLSSSDRIVGGYTAKMGKYPWLARLGNYRENPYGVKSNKLKFSCGGALVNRRFVLTAAHCCSDEEDDGSLEVVRLGEFDVVTNPDCVKGLCADKVEDYDVNEVITHPHYEEDKFQHDICLVKMEKKVQFTNYIRPICMPYGPLITKNFVSEIGEVAGWGITTIKLKKTSRRLMALKVNITEVDVCDKSYIKYARVGPNQICAGGELGKDSCAGDSGGPLMKIEVVGDHPPRYFVIGVISFGVTDCGATDIPAVYTNVAKYIKWMLDSMNR